MIDEPDRKRKALLHIGDRQSRATADQLTTVSKQRFINQAGVLAHTDMRKVEHVVKIQLGLLDPVS